MRKYSPLSLFLTLLVSGGVVCLDLATQEDLSEYGPNISNFTKEFEEFFKNYDDDFLKGYISDDDEDEAFHRHHRHASTDDYDGLKEGSGWSMWSSWSGCSRTCGGGASMQSRRCMDHNGCRGDSVRYRVCNDVSCEKNAQEFRAVQCAEYDGLPHDGKLYEWEPALSEEPCSLTCRAKGGGPVVTLNSRVHDGTRCYDGQDDHMCINGRCQKIGCDKTLGSGLELDECGKCGGNGSTCNRPDYYWDSQPTGPCSTTCGGGYQILSSVCLDRKDSRVNEDRCDPSTRPHSLTTTCNDHTCPTRWQTGSWASCSASCGTGYQLREVYCTEPRGRDHVKVADHYCTNKRPGHRQKCNTHDCPQWYSGFWSQCSTTCGSGTQARAVHCRDARDRSSETCDPSKRPHDTRPCRTGVTCPQSPPQQHPQHQNTPSWWGEEAGGGVGLASEEGVAPLMPRPQALTTDQQVPSEPTYMTGNWSACSVTCGDGIRTRSVTCKIFLEFSRTVAVLPDDQCPGIKPPSSNGCVLPPCPHAMTRDAAHEPSIASLEDPNESFHINKDTDADGPKVHETPFLPLLVDEDAANTPQAEDEDVLAMSAGDLPIPQAQAYNKPHPALHSFEAPGEHQQFVPDDPMHGSHFDHYDSYEMANNKAHRRPVKGRTADMNSIEIDLGGGEDAGSYPGSYLVGEGDDYKWTTSGFSPCSVSCLGGVQESVVRCIRKQDEKIVDPGLCQLTERPDMITRTCNDQPCPPRWNITDFNTCSQQCGGGIQVREVVCIHEVTRGGRNTLVVPDSLCPQPPPHAQRHCNMLDCMPQWTPGKWSKCSKTCGGGVKTREVTCQQTLSLGQVVDKPHTDCPRRRPAHIRKCNKRACHSNTIGGQISHLDHPIIYAQIRQNYVQSKFMKKLTLKVGGSATVFRGVMVKVKCPVRRFDRSRITWWFEGSQVGTAGNSIVTSKGVLKIRKVQYVDAGVYICRAGLSEAKLRLMVKALPASFSSSEERNPPGGERNEVSQIGYGSQMKSNNNKYNKDYKTSWMSSGSERRKGRRRDRDRKKNKAERKQASSKNIHTVEEVSSNESSNAFDTGQAASRHDYVYGTVTHHTSATSSDKDEPPQGKGPLDKWDFGSNIFGSINHLTDENIVSKEIPPVFGKVNHHSKGSRITSDEHHVFGTITHHKPPATTNLTDPPERTPIYSLESSGNSIEDDLKSLGNKLSLSEESSVSNNQRTVGRGGRHVTGHHGLETHDLVKDSETTTEDPLGTPQFLGKGTRDSLEFEWRMTNWSECSQTCGFSGSSGGYQVRSTQCVVWVNNVSTPVNSELCTNAGLATPATFQRCGLEECPQWHVNDWSDCETSRCFTLHYAFQRREVQCRLHNETEVGSERCDERTKPRHRRECYNHQCTGVWRVGDWSECTAPCGGQGYRTRVLQCVWNGTKKAAGNACREQPRPEVVRWCDGAACPSPSM